jgi:hypothetical protein
MSKPRALEDEIGRKLREAELSGELRAAKDYGKPLTDLASWRETPEELRMSFKILKDAGVVPAEVEMLNRRAAMRAELSTTTDLQKIEELKTQLSALEMNISLRLEALRS